jgi:hypothetical protein
MTINNELGRSWKEAITIFKLAYRNLSEGTEEKQRRPRREESVFQPRFESGGTRIKAISVIA